MKKQTNRVTNFSANLHMCSIVFVKLLNKETGHQESIVVNDLKFNAYRNKSFAN